MDEQELIQIIDARGKKPARRRWNCPSNRQTAGYLEHRLEPTEKMHFEAHLADCDFCLVAVGAVVRQRRSSEPVDVPAYLHREAVDMAPARSEWRLSWKWLLIPALASLVVITGIWRRSAQTERLVASAPLSAVGAQRSPEAIPQIPLQTPEKPQVRELAARKSALQLLEPAPHSVWPKQEVRFRWRPVANATYYEIRVVNSEGDLMWRAQESNSTAQIPPNLSLQPGKYFVWVRAYLNDDRTVKSDARAFWIRSSS
jgi:hypothetical protein